MKHYTYKNLNSPHWTEKLEDMFFSSIGIKFAIIISLLALTTLFI